MKKLLFFILLCNFGYANAQISGKVVDVENQPIEFVNVSLHSIQDSSLIAGETTNKRGEFEIISKIKENTFLKISSIGYKTEFMRITQNNVGKVTLFSDTTQLGEVIVKAYRPIYRMENNSLSTRIENTVLSCLGNANDVLAQLPFVSGEDGKFIVFGRGEPLIYINNRVLQDNDELKNLKSSDIEEVKVILTPGSEYSSSVGAVIHISTRQSRDDGLSGSLYALFRKRRLFDHYEYLDLDLRKKYIDYFLKLSYDKTVFRQNQKDQSVLTSGSTYIANNERVMKYSENYWEAITGVNYSSSPNLSTGIRYSFSQRPQIKGDLEGNTFHYINDLNDKNFHSQMVLSRKTRRDYLNAYFYKKLKEETDLRFDFDYVNGSNKNSQSSDYEDSETHESILVNSTNKGNYSLYAGKIQMSISLFGADLLFGAESSSTCNNQKFEMRNKEIAEELPSNTSTAKQELFAGFLSYKYTLNALLLDIGMRYEHIDFKYYYNDEFKKDQSRIYNNWFPNLSLSYQVNNIKMNLSYRTTVRRPNYFNLRSDVSYNDPYLYEGGNPSLKPMFTNSLTYLFGWKDLQMEISYSKINDNLLFVIERFKDKEDIALFTMRNLDNSERLDANISFTPTYGRWRPAFEFGVNKQYLRYEDVNYNRPYCFYRWGNIIQLPNDFNFILNIRGNLKGHNSLQMHKSSFRTDLKLNKSILKDKVDLTFSVTDLFGTALEEWDMTTSSLHFNKWNDADLRGINLQIIYKFNPSRSKYKGQSATNEINRL
ncbi:outer membrane beta-barrel family protein [Proteiniphilum sp. X52]|uniref:outer membrane beta-barrel family protein n=1 Tax=Proteiniphilum sp. X52 TaxID=2382159 RepID=UPI000F09D38A|nr:outer membrane beta-barrel family protein [Proteiniphilum sp. X52]RNC63419.1 TonB-dependent receptor [Proteiniphilum sp. X52]